jgi:GlpG protein
MRQVATIAEETSARKLADHLLTLDVTTRVDRSPGGWIVWVHREDRMDLARREVEAFLADPDNPRYLGASKAAEAARKEEARRQKEHARKTVDLSGRLNVPSFQRCPVTYSLIALSVAVAILTNMGTNVETNIPFVLSPPTITEGWRTVPIGRIDSDSNFVRIERVPDIRIQPGRLDALRRGQVWRLISPIFLHFGVIHLAFNMMMLYRLGSLVEMRKGKLVMIGLVLASAVASNLGQYFWDMQANGPEKYIWRSGGMSGVLYAIFGYCWMKSDYDPESDMKIPTDLIVQMVLWLFLCMSGLLGNIGNAAHVSGLFVGLLIGVAPHLRPSWR